jgi:hypothetical protein
MRYFLRLPYAGQHTYWPSILAVYPDMHYRIMLADGSTSEIRGPLTISDEQILLTGTLYTELHAATNFQHILSTVNVPPTISAWRAALLPYSVVSTPFPKRAVPPDPTLKTNHKIGAPKGKLP